MIFNEELHTYTHNGKNLIPVSTWLKQYVPEFKKDIISKAVAKKQGVSQDLILKKWDTKRDLAASYGTWLHKSIEYYLKYDKDFRNSATKAFKKVMSENQYYSEVIVHDKEVAGTIDLIEVIKKGEVKIIDFKTNEDLNKGYGKLLSLYSANDNIPLNKYKLQLYKYKELLEGMKDVKVVGVEIWHYVKGKFKIIEIDKL